MDAAEAHLPWRVAHTARLGRHAVAKRAIAPGELVLRETGAATIVRQRFLGHVCCVCFSELPAGAAAQPTQVHWCLQCQTACLLNFLVSLPGVPACCSELLRNSTAAVCKVQTP